MKIKRVLSGICWFRFCKRVKRNIIKAEKRCVVHLWKLHCIRVAIVTGKKRTRIRNTQPFFDVNRAHCVELSRLSPYSPLCVFASLFLFPLPTLGLFRQYFRLKISQASRNSSWKSDKRENGWFPCRLDSWIMIIEIISLIDRSIDAFTT